MNNLLFSAEEMKGVSFEVAELKVAGAVSLPVRVTITPRKHGLGVYISARDDVLALMKSTKCRLEFAESEYSYFLRLTSDDEGREPARMKSTAKVSTYRFQVLNPMPATREHKGVQVPYSVEDGDLVIQIAKKNPRAGM